MRTMSRVHFQKHITVQNDNIAYLDLVTDVSRTITFPDRHFPDSLYK